MYIAIVQIPKLILHVHAVAHCYMDYFIAAGSVVAEEGEGHVTVVTFSIGAAKPMFILTKILWCFLRDKLLPNKEVMECRPTCVYFSTLNICSVIISIKLDCWAIAYIHTYIAIAKQQFGCGYAC